MAHGHSSIEIFHSLIPLLFVSDERPDWRVVFVDHLIFDLRKFSGDMLILLRRFDSTSSDHEIKRDLDSFRGNFNKIVYFDDRASATTKMFNVASLVDVYWTRAKLRDVSLYSTSHYGGQIFSDYYHKQHGIVDEEVFYSPIGEEQIAADMKIAWNIGIGAYPTHRNGFLNYHHQKVKKILTLFSVTGQTFALRKIIKIYLRQMEVELSKEINVASKHHKVSARFQSHAYRNSVAYQRVLYEKLAVNNGTFLTGLVPQSQFLSETGSIKGILSPFGWGEICFRDFEAILGGALLIKADMDHIETWPNIYTSNSYYPIAWNGSDIESVSDLMVSENFLMHRIESARQIYKDALLNYTVRAVAMIEESFKCHQEMSL